MRAKRDNFHIPVQSDKRTKEHTPINLNSARLINGDTLGSLPIRSAQFLDIPDNIQTFDNLSKHNMFPIKPGSDDLSSSAPPIPGEKRGEGEGWYSSDEELRSVGVWTGVCHGKKTWFRVLQFEILVCEFLSINGFSTRTTTQLASIPDSRGGGGRGDTCDE